MLHIFRCPPINHIEVTEEEPYLVAGVYPICDEWYSIAKEGSEWVLRLLYSNNHKDT